MREKGEGAALSEAEADEGFKDEPLYLNCCCRFIIYRGVNAKSGVESSGIVGQVGGGIPYVQ
jgi:hypothetical protein